MLQLQALKNMVQIPQLFKVTKIHIKIIWYCLIQADKIYIYLDYLASIK